MTPNIPYWYGYRQSLVNATSEVAVDGPVRLSGKVAVFCNMAPVAVGSVDIEEEED